MKFLENGSRPQPPTSPTWSLVFGRSCYGVATISRLLQNIGLFCKRALQKRRYSANETCNLVEPTTCSHPISVIATLFVRMRHGTRTQEDKYIDLFSNISHRKENLNIFNFEFRLFPFRVPSLGERAIYCQNSDFTMFESKDCLRPVFTKRPHARMSESRR